MAPTSILVKGNIDQHGDIVPGPGNESYSRIPLNSISAPALELHGNGSHLILDFGVEVGGLVTLQYTVMSTASQNDSSEPAAAIGLAFSETSDHIGEFSDCSNNPKNTHPDGAIYSNITGPGDQTYAMPQLSLRGGFRYLTLFLLDESSAYTAKFNNITLDIAFQPTWTNLRAYQGYFHSDDAMLNRIWYGGAYTLQTNVVPPSTGRHSPSLSSGWANNGNLGPGSSILVDGAKRDRAVWPGDMGVAVPSLTVSTGDLESVKNSLQVMYNYQNKDGSFPEAGPPLLQQGSDTYHMWTMIGTYNYVLYTNDTDFLASNWNGYVRAMTFITGKRTYSSGLLHVTGTRDWARFNVGANMTEAQVILYQTLVTGATLSEWLEGPNSNNSATWSAAANDLRSAILSYCFDDAYGALRDNATETSLYPQDANSLALAMGLVNRTATDEDTDTIQRISARLTDNWGPYGPSAPELPGEVSPFISSWEVRGHLVAGQTDRALTLMRTLWGKYLDRPTGSQSTLVEGFLASDGSYGYRYNQGYGGNTNDPAVAASYTSHSHGWSAGPTSALTEFILGLSVTGRAGSTWSFAPQLSISLTSVEGGFATPLGLLRASWTRKDNSYTASVSAALGTNGTLVLPIANATSQSLRIIVNGCTVRPRQYRTHTSHVTGVANTVEFPVKKGGDFDINVSW